MGAPLEGTGGKRGAWLLIVARGSQHYGKCFVCVTSLHPYDIAGRCYLGSSSEMQLWSRAQTSDLFSR